MSIVNLSRNMFFLRVIYSIIPSVLIFSVLWFAVFGEQGLFRYHMLQQSLGVIRFNVSEIEEVNGALSNQIVQLKGSERQIRLQAAERLYRSSEGAVIYRFND
jgi:Mg2+/citrate symporter